MLHRFALALGLLFLGMYVEREISRTRPVRIRLRQSRGGRPQRLLSAPVGKASLH